MPHGARDSPLPDLVENPKLKIPQVRTEKKGAHAAITMKYPTQMQKAEV